MAKFYGTIGYAETEETVPGVWVEKITERDYFGDLNRINHRLESSGNVNDNINLSHQISIVSDPYAEEHVHSMRYVKFSGAKWKINSVEVQYPRLILTVGGLYNGGEQA